jgi:tRNA modification GTPase
LILETFAAQGIEVCSWQELERRTGDQALQTRAALALTEARTGRTAAILLNQFHGALERELTAILAALRGDNHAESSRLLAQLAGRSTLGRHLTSPWRIAVAGAPNVGKSSLVNALAGFQRSVVSASPGTTRDVVTTVLAIDGWPVELSDTAGLRDGVDALEQTGVHQARAALASADLCLWVLDASTPPIWPPVLTRGVQLVVNKSDLAPAWDLGQAGDAIRVSARAGTGLAEVCQALGRRLVPEPPSPGAAIPFTDALACRIADAQQHLAAGHPADACRALEMALQGGE